VCSANGMCASDVCGTTGAGMCCVAACSPVGGACGATGCSGTGACDYPGTAIACSTSCSLGTLTTFDCNGSGACNTTGGTSAACGGNLLCASITTCLVGCGANSAVGDANCASGFYCNGVGVGFCVAMLSPGTLCQRATECLGGVCTNSICDQCTDGVKDGNETDVDCGGATCGACANGKTCAASSDCQSVECVSLKCLAANVIVVGAGSGGSYGAELHPSTLGNGTWSSPTSLTAASVSDVGLAFIASGATPEAVGVMHQAQTDDLVYTTWTPGSFAAFAAVASGVTTREVPAIAGFGGTAFVGFQGLDFNLYFESFNGTSWLTTPTSILATSGLPTPPGMAASVVSMAPSAVYFNASNDPAEEDCSTSGTCGSATVLGTDVSYVSTPSVVAMNGGSFDLLTVYVRQSDGELIFNTRTSGTTTWSTSAAIAGATAPTVSAFGPVERVGLAALSGGNAIVAWQDNTTNGIFYALFNGTTWTSPAPLSTPNVILPAPAAAAAVSAIAITHGVANATAEMAYVDSSGNANHTRLVGGSWTTPVVAITGQSLSHVSIATSP